MGGVIGLAIVAAAYKGYVQSRLNVFSTPERGTLFKSVEMIADFDIEAQDRIRVISAGGYNLQFGILIAFAAAQITSLIPLWRKEQIRILETALWDMVWGKHYGGKKIKQVEGRRYI